MCGYKQSSTRSEFYSVIEIYSEIEYIRGIVCKMNQWHPDQIDQLELQDENYRGLFWHYNEILKDIANENKQNIK